MKPHGKQKLSFQNIQIFFLWNQYKFYTPKLLKLVKKQLTWIFKKQTLYVDKGKYEQFEVELVSINCLWLLIKNVFECYLLQYSMSFLVSSHGELSHYSLCDMNAIILFNKTQKRRTKSGNSSVLNKHTYIFYVKQFRSNTSHKTNDIVFSMN